MRSPVDLWVYLSTSPLIWLTLTLCTWIGASEISRRLDRNPLANPVLTSILFLSLVMTIFDIPYERFFEGAQFVHFLLGPATVAIAVPLFRQWARVKRLLLPIAAALMVGSLMAVLSVVALGSLLGLSDEVMISFLPKSATAGVAMAISASLGGNPSLTAVLVILTGIIGALIVTPFMNLMQIRDYAARGFAVGLTSHGIGTARAYEVDETAGLFAGIAMALNAVATAAVVPIAAAWLIR
ncbi:MULTISPECIES: LrgB family protein [Pseudorhizobium]|jgi:predicted murein hydrolase (TIGR00659 family)|uniref:Membrane protein n=1 Tax=Pseudorhizobium pelagicum TaxID=1509405 RepID=A0A922NXG1_9HYPH|nr:MULTISPECIES: LrgB family protein [Pseudorhizobium]MBU1313284.1 LrgB family protein [Alphaproteobacteria bacterium]KEQ05674.1 membrane protein [Pseudorhizobium pelagicum]KEQ06354.1 membrane protein [Pseudorhizobium pelagicum]MBU1549321.1 LrgB family protein [Alphaproteobacteria bacterium]MBU2338350.1 LrgB family protein [Alphaproteobacteria bacterium]